MPRSRVNIIHFILIEYLSLGLTDTVSSDYVTKYASKQAADEAGEDTESEDEMSSVGSFGSEDEEPVGQMEV